MGEFDLIWTDEEKQEAEKEAYNKALDDFVENISLPMTEEQIGEIVEKLRR